MVRNRIAKIAVIALLALVPVLFIAASLAEGMFPLSEISKIDLKKAGLKIKTTEVYNPNGTSLVDALVRVGGCTGSFVSADGLIITNHHCAFSSAAAASSPENDYITNGFLAADRSKEIRTSLTCRITASYVDVSGKVLAGTENITDANEKAALIKANLQKITAEEQAANPTLEIEISEMFIGKAYTLFRYQQIKDVRLVYIPHRSIGEFGGESDNWVWPRHNGDFAFLRAYAAPDGSPAEYSESNVPYKPKKFLAVNPNGVKENDFVFVLGYPGRTYRHQPAAFLDYQYNQVLPTTSEWYDYQIETIEELSRKDKAFEIALASRVKSLANVTKNYKGKLTGLDRTTIIEDRKADEDAMKKMIEGNADLKSRYGTLFSDINAVYAERNSTFRRNYYIAELVNAAGPFYLASFISYHKNEIKNLTGKDSADYIAKVQAQRKTLEKYFTIRNKQLDKKLVEHLLLTIYNLPKELQVASVTNTFTGPDAEATISAAVENADKKDNMFDREYILGLLDKDPAKLLAIDNELVTISEEIFNLYNEYITKNTEHNNRLTELNARLLEVKQMYKKTDFIPDANSTLRFTYGNVKGYWPNDAEYNAPFTTVKGIIEKAKTSGDYYLESHLKEIMKRANPDGIVCLLYNLDTTGGNSGSPILDAKGQLVGVNFDRATTACINDYAWDDKYSRSIGVDIRYVIFVLKEIAKAPHLVSEMGVKS
ncbi:MAG TPA: S46 family peptidase [Bacteroidia bacterium]|nr:S46 family peptidase [Bacteroidia bacterium]